MSEGYRDDLAAAQARVAELEAKLGGEPSSDLATLERQHAALVRSVPTRGRVRLIAGLAIFVSLVTLASMLFLSSPYDHHPRFQIAMQMLGMAAMAFLATTQWLSRVMTLQSVKLSERLLAAERARVALESRARIAEQPRVAIAEPLEEAAEEAATRTSQTRR
ncbi:MAG TPA: hypothetical protein VGH28_00635 [Polyangiaceae bacterium]|jgi:hypothetical protein